MARPVSNLRRGRWQSWVCGLLVTLIVASLQITGDLDFAERWSFDKRVKYCQLFYKQPTPSPVVVLLVDEGTLRSLGSWPWPRAKLAEVIDEINRAGPRTIGLDVLLKEHKDGDDVLAATIARAGNIVLPVEIELAAPKKDGALVEAIRSVLRDDPELTPVQVADALRSRPEATAISDEALRQAVEVEFGVAREDALLARINEGIRAGKSDQDIRRATLPKWSASGGRSALTRLMDELLASAHTAAAVRERLPHVPTQVPLLLGEPTSNISLQEMLTAAKSVGFVDYKVTPGGKLYWVPLMADLGGGMMPQFALAVACAQLGVDLREPDQFKLTENYVELRPPGGSPILVPVRTELTAERRLWAGALFEVPFRGRRLDPWSMFDRPSDRGANARHVVPLTQVGQLFERRDTLRANNAAADRLIRFFLGKISVAEVERFNALQLSSDEFIQRREWLSQLVNHPQLNVLEADYRELKPEEMDADAEMFIKQYRKLTDNIATNDKLLAEIASMRDQLRSLVQDRAVIFGFAASGMVDRVATALHDSLPGAMVHAAIVNGILGGSEMWRKAPLWLNVCVTLLLGIIATWLVTCRGQYRAHLAALALLIAYALINGFVVFDIVDYILTLGYPMIVIAGVWGVVTARRALVEALTRAKVESEFRTYVDPALVDLVLSSKTGGRIRAQRREMSIVFIDMEGFTAGAERLKSRAARVVNFYMDTMVKIIRANGGYVNKFLGDGIMFFFNAPNENKQHAPCAVRTVLEIQSALQNVLSGRRRRRTGFKIRAGISTGIVTVGDAGSSDASDYTVLGDIANLGSRLESANKQFGTNCAVMDRTIELCNGEFLMRPLGRFRVVGRAEPVEVFEPIALMNRATEQHHAYAIATAEMVQRFKLGDFSNCVAAIDGLESVSGPTKLTALYRQECARRVANPDANDKADVIDLSQK